MRTDGRWERAATPARHARAAGLALLAAALGCAGAPPRAATPAASRSALAADVALGDSIFHGRVGGALCSVCHGRRGGGTARGARLSDTTWRHGDGSLASIVAVVSRGIPGADSTTVPMLPHGGARLTEREIRAVAAYVHQLGGGR